MPGGADTKIIIDMRAIATEGEATASLAPDMQTSLEELMHPSMPGLKSATWDQVSPICDFACEFADTIAAGRSKLRYMIRDVAKSTAGLKA